MSRARNRDATEATRSATVTAPARDLQLDCAPVIESSSSDCRHGRARPVHRRCTAMPVREFQMRILQVSSALSLFLLISCGPNGDPESATGEPTARLGAGA